MGSKGNGFYVTRTQAVVIVLLFIVIAVCIGLMAGLIPDKGDNEIVIAPAATDSPGTGVSTTTPEPPVSEGPWEDLRLNEEVRPTHYDLWFYPDFYNDGTTFYGREDVTIDVGVDSQYLLIHYKLMDITKTELRDVNGNVLPIRDTFEYPVHEYWVVEPNNVIPADTTVILHLEFTGSLVNGIVGYYKSTYFNTLTGRESWMATTKFQPTDARKAFPCFDEPSFKATYTVTLRHWSNFTALGNQPMETEVDDEVPGFMQTTFQETLTMSTYLVCFIVTDFEYVENTIGKDNKPNRVWAAPDRLEQAWYALNTTKVIFEYFEDLYDMDYQPDKLDQVAVPDYPSGATEHWGLMTYRQSNLLYDETQVSASGKQRVATIISHELVHNYFGNTITCHWWDEIWLNEGFANYFQAIGVGVAEETWEMEDHFVVYTQQRVMNLDASTNSRSVVVTVETPEEINAAFDGITYDKGASMLRMIESFLGPDLYIAGIQLYLRENAMSTVTTDKLWSAFQEVIDEQDDFHLDQSISDIMTPWVEQMGLPEVMITSVDPDSETLVFAQQRFMNSPNASKDEPESEHGYQWSIPLTFSTSGGRSGLVWLSEESQEREVPIFETTPPEDDAWIKFNSAQKGFYRVNYPDEVWSRFGTLLTENIDTLEPVDRSNLLDDAFNLARAARLNYATALDLTEYLEGESHYFPWRSSKSGLDYISLMFYGERGFLLWRAYVREITTFVMDELDFVDDPDENHLDRLLRSDIVQLSCDHGYVPCQQSMTTTFNAWIADPENTLIGSTLQPLVYEFGIKYSRNGEEWETVRDRYLVSQSSQEQSYLLFAMAQAQELYLIQSYLDFISDNNNVRDQDFVSAVSNTASNPAATLYVWNWLKVEYEALEERFGIEDRNFARMIPNYVDSFSTEYLYQDVANFYAEHPEAGAGELPRQQSLDSIRNNIEWKERNVGPITAWLEAR